MTGVPDVVGAEDAPRRRPSGRPSWAGPNPIRPVTLMINPRFILCQLREALPHAPHPTPGPGAGGWERTSAVTFWSSCPGELSVTTCCTRMSEMAPRRPPTVVKMISEQLIAARAGARQV